MPNYQNGKIYTLRSHQTDNIYIGSTIEKLSSRMAKHRCDYKRWKEGTMNYVTSFEILQYDDCYIELLEIYPCNCKMELEQREGKFIREMDCVNKLVAGRNKKEYNKENKVQIAGWKKEYYEKNKQKFVEYNKEYYKENKGKLKEYNKEYYKKNKEIKLKYNKEKITCPCGSVINRNSKSRHEKTKKHKKWVEQQQQ